MDSYFRAKDILDKAMGTDSYFQIKSILFGLKAADVVEVVRCKDCEWFCETHDEMDSLVCLNRQWDNGQPWRAAVKPDDFCSYGSRMDKEE